MTNHRSRILLQESRFALIQCTAEEALDNHPASNTRPLITTRLEVLESNWSQFQTEHESICQEDTGSPYNDVYQKQNL